jgi:hypothetical protein
MKIALYIVIGILMGLSAFVVVANYIISDTLDRTGDVILEGGDQ